MKKKKSDKGRWSVTKHEPDEFWFGGGYYTVGNGESYVITSDKYTAREVVALLNKNRKKKV